MDVKFKLRRLHLAVQQAGASSAAATEAKRLLQHELLLICRRFLDSKQASLVLPTTSPMLVRLKEELQSEASELQAQTKPDDLLMQRMIEKLDAMRMQTRIDFKRMSFERFASFLTSALYRDFIVHPGSGSSSHCTRVDDLTHLLRISRIPFHQTAVSSPRMRDLRDLRDQGNELVFDKAMATVFTFRATDSDTNSARGLHFTYRSLYVSSTEDDATGECLRKKVECFLVPEGTKPTGEIADATRRSPICFNFLAGTGDETLYGALWRFGGTDDANACSNTESAAKKSMQGVCVLSRYPIVDGLREYLRAFATAYEDDEIVEFDIFEDESRITSAAAMAQDAFVSHVADIVDELMPSSEREVIDSSFQDAFECLSITNVMRLFSLILQEKKIVLVSSSYSVLLSVGESLRTMVYPLIWSHIYVPVLPMAMKGYLHCPTPFIFGLHSSYVRQCELPKPSDDFAVVNLDRDSVTGGGDVFLPPSRANALREKLTALCKPRLHTRDSIGFRVRQPAPSLTAPFPSDSLRRVFQEELQCILRHLETFAFRFECADRTVSVVDSSNKSRRWPADAARFNSALLQSQAFSTYLGSKCL